MAGIRNENVITHYPDNHYQIKDGRTEQSFNANDLEPGSPEWLAWLDSLHSFHFKGRLGHFTAIRDTKPKKDLDIDVAPLHYWHAYRKAYGKQFKKYLGRTRALTLEKLEEAADALQEMVLKHLPEDAMLEQNKKPAPEGITLGAVSFVWQEGPTKDEHLLLITTPEGAQYLNQRQTQELLAYLYHNRGSILK